MLYILLLLFLFLVFFALEFFIPSGGVLGICAAAALIGAVVVGFLESPTTGFGVLIIGLLLVPLAFAFMIRIYPKTPMGRNILGPPLVEQKRLVYLEYLHRVGVAKTDLLPAGRIDIDGRRLDAISTGVAIDKGSVVEVVSVDGNRIHVRPTNQPLPASSTKAEAAPPTLETPVESLGLDDLSDPLS